MTEVVNSVTDVLKLKKSNCMNCYKCIRNCPVKSIRFSAGQAHIVNEDCILCGQCLVVCPQNAKEIVSDVEKVKTMIASGATVIASVAPSFAANYSGVGIEDMEKALQKLGFASTEETALGATLVKQEYDKMLKEKKKDIVISSCCHSVNLLIQKHYPEALPYLADILSPMQAHCTEIKQKNPEAKTVFIGPCISKKDEAARYGSIVDAVLTFEELSQWLSEANISLEKTRKSNPKSRARYFPTTGGILKTMLCDCEDYTYLAIDGVENCIRALEDILEGKLSNCFVEMSACVGSCIGGPVMEKTRRSPIGDYQQIASYAGKEDFDVSPISEDMMHKNHMPLIRERSMPSEEEITKILAQMGKRKPEDELNCGTCGYDTCRQKAIAVFQGKADLNMCLPFLKEKAENFSDNIIKNTPNGILVLNDELEIQQINRAALKILNIHSASDVLGEQVIRVLDPKDFMDVQETGKSIRDRNIYLAEYKKYVEETILYDRDYKILICLLRDITEEQEAHDEKEQISKQTADIADKVVQKQMCVVQEIASLLGETAAETKIALTKLKESISNE